MFPQNPTSAAAGQGQGQGVPLSNFNLPIQPPTTTQASGSGPSAPNLSGILSLTVDQAQRFGQVLNKLRSGGGLGGGGAPPNTPTVPSYQQPEPRTYFPQQQQQQPCVVRPVLSARGNPTEGMGRVTYGPTSPCQQGYPRRSNDDDGDEEYTRIKATDLRRLVEAATHCGGGGMTTTRSPPSRHGNSQRYSPPFSSGPRRDKPVKMLQDPRDLHPLGRFERLDRHSTSHKIISTYVGNSHDIPERFGRVKIHDIYAFQKPSKQKLPKVKSQPSFKMLLFCKTTPNGVKKLTEMKDTCLSFYDRAARAFAVQPQDLKGPLRQIILLCSVSLGKKTNSKHGYAHWKKRGYPQACDSVKGQGRLTPIWEGNKELDGGVIVPCGRTKEHRKYPSYELEYSEYIIWEVRRAKVRFAVDIEVELNGVGEMGRDRGGERGRGYNGVSGGGGGGGSGGVAQGIEDLLARALGGVSMGGGATGGGDEEYVLVKRSELK